MVIFYTNETYNIVRQYEILLKINIYKVFCQFKLFKYHIIRFSLILDPHSPLTPHKVLNSKYAEIHKISFFFGMPCINAGASHKVPGLRPPTS